MNDEPKTATPWFESDEDLATPIRLFDAPKRSSEPAAPAFVAPNIKVGDAAIARAQVQIGCQFCIRLRPGFPLTCEAFPTGIPLPILSGDLAHDRPVKGDHGLRFEWNDAAVANALNPSASK